MENKVKICPVTRLEIIESPKWQDLHLNKKYKINFRKIGNHIVDVKGNGISSEFDADKFHKLLMHFIEDQNIVFPYAEMRDYSSVKGMLVPKEAIIKQKDYLIKEAKERVAFIAYEAPSTMSYLLKSGKRRYEKVSVVVQACNNYEAAVLRSLEVLQNLPQSVVTPIDTRDKSFKVTYDDLETLISYSGQFLWEKKLNGHVDVGFDDAHPFYPVVENLMLVKETLLNVEDEAIVKSKALAHEQIQMTKIVEALETGVIIIHPRTNSIVDVNPAACKILKGDKEILVGLDYSDFLKDNISNNENKWLLLDREKNLVPVIRKRVEILLNEEKFFLENIVDIEETQKYEDQLKQALEETEKINNFTMNREKRIIEMKIEVNQLLKALGKEIKYKSVE